MNGSSQQWRGFLTSLAAIAGLVSFDFWLYTDLTSGGKTITSLLIHDGEGKPVDELSSPLSGGER